ncbi:unnamed protein product [Leptosia nina]|uniref:Uncharacterized protein n=1 Tax=Leptosia nina TaxID=320188 RepID=A0AAV1K299_9NEOP
MADRGKHRVAPIPAKKQYAYVPCPRSEEVGTEFALQLLRTHHEEPPTPEKSPPEKRENFIVAPGVARLERIYESTQRR